MKNKKFCVIGCGYFGLNLALRLTEFGAEVLAIDKKEEIIDRLADKVTHVLSLDTTEKRAMQSLGLKDMDAVIVAIGEGFESSILTTAILQEIGVKNIYNRVTSPTHERLLKLMDINELLVPEAEAADHLANRLMLPGLIEIYKITEDYGIYEIAAPKVFHNKTLIEINLRKDYSLNLVTIKRLIKKRGILTLGEKQVDAVIGVPSPDTKIMENDVLVVSGDYKSITNLIEESF